LKKEAKTFISLGLEFLEVFDQVADGVTRFVERGLLTRLKADFNYALYAAGAKHHGHAYV